MAIVTTKSQQRAIDSIKQHFKNHWSVNNDLHKFVITKQKETGFQYISVYTTDNPYTMAGGHFKVGRRGGIEVLSVYDLCQDKKSQAERYAKKLGGKVSKYF